MNSTDRARALLEERLEVIDTLSETTRRVEAAKSELAAAQKEHITSWAAARNAGWTDTELTGKLGFTRPANRAGGRPKGTRTKRSRPGSVQTETEETSPSPTE